MLALQKTEEEAPPFLRSWRRIYLLVLVYLFMLILVLWFFTRQFA